MRTLNKVLKKFHLLYHNKIVPLILNFRVLKRKLVYTRLSYVAISYCHSDTSYSIKRKIKMSKLQVLDVLRRFKEYLEMYNWYHLSQTDQKFLSTCYWIRVLQAPNNLNRWLTHECTTDGHKAFIYMYMNILTLSIPSILNFVH